MGLGLDLEIKTQNPIDLCLLIHSVNPRQAVQIWLVVTARRSNKIQVCTSRNLKHCCQLYLLQEWNGGHGNMYKVNTDTINHQHPYRTLVCTLFECQCLLNYSKCKPNIKYQLHPCNLR